jgi:hypothetical protein
MRPHQGRSSRSNNRVVRKHPLPPGIETFGGRIQTRMKPLFVQPISRSRELAALEIKLLVRIHFVVFRSGST